MKLWPSGTANPGGAVSEKPRARRGLFRGLLSSAVIAWRLARQTDRPRDHLNQEQQAANRKPIGQAVNGLAVVSHERLNPLRGSSVCLGDVGCSTPVPVPRQLSSAERECQVTREENPYPTCKAESVRDRRKNRRGVKPVSTEADSQQRLGDRGSPENCPRGCPQAGCRALLLAEHTRRQLEPQLLDRVGHRTVSTRALGRNSPLQIVCVTGSSGRVLRDRVPDNGSTKPFPASLQGTCARNHPALY
jgi:hypothetical protein